ncbi:hypothetical protein MGG_01297 [Pyricularia oryzae 70-15]|uniref:Flavin-nucleotide-binding protein n=2 Tax=Pyricularia oryzae TaxID=318829 RepID=G4MY82_PYRO7|nr:uncharacterized protein MGG_01297 [Pyricularia oryzae 70-15]EHA54413.1 hypothetical protein MGG_01297 [Pyricularia oryzae 70-15]
MPRYELEYPQNALNSVKRHNERGDYSLTTIHTIINSSRILHVSFTDPSSPFPITLPMIGKVGSFARPSSSVADVLDLYLHGYVSMRMANVARSQGNNNNNNNNSSSSSSSSSDGSNGRAGVPVCVSAAHVDGLVLALSPFSSSYNYRSAVLFGHAVVVTDEAEKLYAMELITNGVASGRWENSRQPPTAGEIQSTSVLRVKIQSGSAKVRAGEPHEETRDAKDEELVGRVWTGVVPVYEMLGNPLPASANRVAEVPAHLADYVKDSNEFTLERALQAAVEPEKKATR